MAIDFSISGGPKAVTIKGPGSSSPGAKFTLALSLIPNGSPGSNKRVLLGTVETPPNIAVSQIGITVVLPDGDYDLSQNGRWYATDPPTLMWIDQNGGCTAPTAYELSV